MTSRERLLAALDGGTADRLPVTTHHLMPYFLDTYMQGISAQDFFDCFDMDAICWTLPHRPDTSKGEYYDPEQGPLGFLQSRRIATDQWRVKSEEIPDPKYKTTRYSFVTPERTLTMTLQSNPHTDWVTEPLIKQKNDIELLAKYMTHPKCDVEAVNKAAEELGDRGIVRGNIAGMDVYGQGGCWQDACCLVGTQEMIMATYDDPEWVHELLGIIYRRKETFCRSLAGARYDVMEHGGGAASSTVISPRLFEKFVAPYDAPLTRIVQEAGIRVVYHTCGGMMPLLEMVADMGVDVMETFTPRGMGGDVDLAEAKRRIGDRVCMIGGFDQFHYFSGCTPEQTRAEVRRCFEEAGQGGGYILCPSDHFFDADPALIAAFADEARRCTY